MDSGFAGDPVSRNWLKDWLKLKLRLRAFFACLHDLVVLENRMADVTEQMSNQGVLCIVVNLHDEFGQGTATGRIPVERGDTSIPEWGIDTAGMTETPEPMICPILEECGTVWLEIRRPSQ